MTVSWRYGLALHTTTPELGLAIAPISLPQPQDPIPDSSPTASPDPAPTPPRFQVLDLGRDLGNQLHLRLQAFLQPQTWQDLGYVAIAAGPGGFTGTRMGIVVARTLAQQLDLPLFAVSTLAAYAVAQWAGETVARSQAIALSMRAQRGELFTALYQQPDPHQLPQAIWPDQVMTPEAWAAQQATWSMPRTVMTVEGGIAASVTQVLAIAQCRYYIGERPHWSEASPFYGQHPVVLVPTP